MSSCFIVVNLIALRSQVACHSADVVHETIGENGDDCSVLGQAPKPRRVRGDSSSQAPSIDPVAVTERGTRPSRRPAPLPPLPFRSAPPAT